MGKGNSAIWSSNFEKLKRFSELNGLCNVPFKGEYRMLAKWTTRQRKAHLSDEQRERLDSIGYCWLTKQDKDDLAWNELFQRLALYAKVHGNCLVPQTYPSDPELGTWVANQRRLDKQKRVREDRRLRLTAIGFQWVVHTIQPKQQQATNSQSSKTQTPHFNSKYDTKWMTMFEKLKQYHKVNGDCLVPYNYPPDPSLAMWVSTQRREYSQKSWYGTERCIRQDRKELLDSIGFCWDNRVLKDATKVAAETLLALQQHQKQLVQQQSTGQDKMPAPNKVENEDRRDDNGAKTLCTIKLSSISKDRNNKRFVRPLPMAKKMKVKIISSC